MRFAWLVLVMVLLLGGCGGTAPLRDPKAPRDPLGRVVDPVYGTPVPGTPAGNGSM